MDVSPKLSYGKTLTDSLGCVRDSRHYIRDGQGYTKTPLGTTTCKYDLFGYDAGVSFPYRISKYTALTANIRYDHLNTKFEDNRDKDNIWSLNLHMEDFPGM